MPSRFTNLPGAAELAAYADRDSIAGRQGWFWFATPLITIPIGGPAANVAIGVDATADFLALELMGHSTQEDVAVPVSFYTVEIASSSSDRNYQSNPLSSRLVCGTATLPHTLSVPILFPHASAILLTVTALNVAVAYGIRLAFGGVKLYKY